MTKLLSTRAIADGTIVISGQPVRDAFGRVVDAFKQEVPLELQQDLSAMIREDITRLRGELSHGGGHPKHLRDGTLREKKAGLFGVLRQRSSIRGGRGDGRLPPGRFLRACHPFVGADHQGGRKMISARSVLFTLASRGITQKIMTVLAFGLAIGLSTATARADVTVDCDAGDTIAGGLAQDNVVFVKGTCNENVVISNSSVQLLADPAGATINGPDITQNTITVNGRFVTIDGLTGGITITGGSNGVLADGVTTVRNVTITSGRTGIVFFQGANGTVDNCTLRNNARDGVSVEGGSATIINSTISGNTRFGIGLFRGGDARIGITTANQYASNTITNNGSDGIHIFLGNAFIGGNTISGNGTDTGSGLRFGISVHFSSADIVGNNTITNNAGSGILVWAGTVIIGDAGFGLPTLNTITGNGASLSTNGGIFGFLGSSLDIRDATISNNTGNGVLLTTQSRARMFNDTIQGNTVDGIAATLGSGVLLQMPTVLVTNNARFGLLCGDRLLSRYFGDISGIHDNGVDQVLCDPFS